MAARKPNRASKRLKKSDDKDNDDEEEEENIRTVKVPLRKILRPAFRDHLTDTIKALALEVTKICRLASLLFICKVQTAFDTENVAFFFKDNIQGVKEIKECFDAVLRQNINSSKMDPSFRTFVDDLPENQQFDWPNNNYMGNAMKDILKQYVKSVKENLWRHRKKRLREFLRVKVYELNQMNHQFGEQDINNAIAWSIHGNESIRDNDINCLAKRTRRDFLLWIIGQQSWFQIENTNLSLYTKGSFFESIQIWISMQRVIDKFNTDHGQRIDHMEHRRQLKRQRRRKRQQQQQQQQQESESESKSQKNENKPPKVKNLAVIPVCGVTRKHYPIDNFTLYKLLCGTGLIPTCKSQIKREGKYERNITFDEFMSNNEWVWNQYVYMRKIKYFVRYKKQFRFRSMSDGLSVSLQYDVEPNVCCSNKEEVVRQYNNGEIPGEAGIDPNDKTWIAYVYRDTETKKEVNVTISSKEYHRLTYQRERDRKAARWTKLFDAEAEADRNSYDSMPSEMSANWFDYISHSLKMLKKGMDAYASDKYTRLSLDKYIISNRVCDNVAGMVTNHKPCIVHLGNAEMAPNRPIRIKKHTRCPGQRKLLRSFKKCPHCYVNLTDEYYTSQTCAKCFKRFDRRTRSHRFKVCTNCEPDTRAMLPSMIVGRKSKRMRRMHKLMVFLMEQDLEDDNGNRMVVDAEHPNELDTASLLSKVMIYRKNWLVNPVTGVLENVNVEQPDFNWETYYQQHPHKSSWDRDIVAAKCIMIKGHCDMFDDPLPETLRRPAAPPWLGVPVAN